LRDEYRDLHFHYGDLLDIPKPNFNSLNSFLKIIDDSIFMIQVIVESKGKASGSGFSVGKNTIVTNRHVVESVKLENIKIIGKNASYTVDKVFKDPTNDVAIIKVSEDLSYLRIGEFNFTEPGEQVLAVGFPSPESDVHQDNIFISSGIVNSIRMTDFCSDRVIFIDSKIGRGMSGGALMNDLGQVIGIITLTKYRLGEFDSKTVALEDQPIALPIHLIESHLKRL
jgi:S1-C subfamily serine protease